MMDNWQEAWEQYAGKVMERLGWLGASLVLFGYYLNANQYISSWLVWVVGNCLVAGYSLHKKAYSTAVMSFLIAIFNIYGYFKWMS
tara:strand:- start:2705 stop:2962 length:258 start_codon:yes stop_codon:yes gene_type:complete